MVNIRNLNDITLALLDFYRVSLPDLDTKPGTVSRDILIDAPASQLALFYDELANISNLQSLRIVSGGDLDKLAQNFGANRKKSTASSGVALLTFNSIPAVIGVNKNDIITAKDGSTFAVLNGISINPNQSNFYRAIATKFQNDLNFLGITDQFAIEVSVQATTPGTSGNVSKYSLNKTNIAGISNITNVFPFTGGNNQETDASFRNRVLSIFSGSNIGTALGYRNLALTNSFISDALVIGPGDPLMTRDGTEVSIDSNGTRTIVSEGTGGKIDIITLGNNISENIDTFIYRDQSNKNDPTDISNIKILGQIPGDENKTITQRRLDNISNGTLPTQPIETLLEASGTGSGSNFKIKSVDNLGRISGNYELIKDAGEFAGSPWGFDKFHWVSDRITDFQEDIIKSQSYGQDSTAFKDVLKISTIQQNIPINNENSIISFDDRSIIQLLHTPAQNITRVFNTNTGERYIITNQNIDGSGVINITGRVQISGNTLPSSTDILQVDYTWIVNYDEFSDFDGKILSNNLRSNTDSIDWGIANTIRNERTLFTLNNNSTTYTGKVKLPISSIIYTNHFKNTYGKVSQSNIVNFSDRLVINIFNLDLQFLDIESIKLFNTEIELYKTSSNNELFINNRVIVNLQIKYNISIILPTDTIAKIDDYVNITYNQLDLFNITNSTGSFSNNIITIPSGNVPDLPSQIYLDTSYIASTDNILSFGIANLPLSRYGNGFTNNSNTGFINSIESNILRRENQTVQKDISNNLFITLSISSSDFSIDSIKIITIINLATNLEIWNSAFPGAISIDVNKKYQLLFSGLNAPNVGDNVLVIYSSDEINKNQPFTFDNKIIKYNIDTLLFDSSKDKFILPINKFILENNIKFHIIEGSTGLSIGEGLDGEFISISSDDSVATFKSSSFDFSTINDLTGKQISISDTININNSGIFNILNVIDTHTITISVITANLNINQISIIKLVDNKEIWNTNSTIDLDNNLLLLPSNISASQGEKVIIILFTNKTLHQSPTRISITCSDQINNSGIITTSGTTITKISNIVFTSIDDGLKQNLLEAIKKYLNVNSNTLISSFKYIARIVKIDKVETTTNDEILSTINSYDILGTQLKNNSLYSNEMTKNISLNNTEFILPETINNINNIPKIGDKLNITFYLANNNDYENIYFTRNGQAFTNKVFALIDKSYISSGFSLSKSAKFTYSYFTQPNTGSRYRAFYDYLAPKQNERILIRYNYNKAISDTTFIIEQNRPITTDILVKSANELLIDATINIVVKSSFVSSSSIVLQNVKDKITSTININSLGGIISSSDIISAAQTIDGVERVRILYFNITSMIGQKLSIIAQKNEFFVANNIIVNQENI